MILAFDYLTGHLIAAAETSHDLTRELSRTDYEPERCLIRVGRGVRF